MNRKMALWCIFFLCLPSSLAAVPEKQQRKIHVDAKHVQLDFLNIFGDWFEMLTDSELDFRYFTAHDYDKNRKLDGLEILTALSHEDAHDDHDNSSTSGDNDGGHKALSFLEIESLIDDIFATDDSNNDGFLDYAEFMKVQKRHPDLGGGKS